MAAGLPPSSAVQAAAEKAARAAAALHRALADAAGRELTVDQWQRALATVGVSLVQLREATAATSSLFGLRSAQARLLRYLRSRVGEVVRGEELEGVSGIGEWARRVRELRVEHGWPIETGTQRSELRMDEYMLVRDEPDQELAEMWQLAKSMRTRRDLSGKDRALEYLKALSPKPADQDQLTYVANISSWQRRLRELDEEGWEIRSNIDEPELAAGTYRLASLEQRPPRARQAIKLRHDILERDDFTCADCGAKRGDAGVRLQVHHKLPVAGGGTNDPANLITLCAIDHAGRHALGSVGEAVDELIDPGGEPDQVVR